jgi:hypothetical protein
VIGVEDNLQDNLARGGACGWQVSVLRGCDGYPGGRSGSWWPVADLAAEPVGSFREGS